MLTLLLKAFYLGICGLAMPLPVFIYLIYKSVQSGARAGRFLFLGHFTASAAIVGLLFLGAKDILLSPSAQIVLLLLGAVMPAILGITMLKSAITEKLEQEVVSHSAYQRPNDGGWLFLTGAVMSFTSVSWTSWCAVSAKGILFGAVQQSGALSALLMVISFSVAVFLLYWLLSVVFSLLGRLMKSTIYRIAVGVLGAAMLVCTVMNLVQIISLISHL